MLDEEKDVEENREQAQPQLGRVRQNRVPVVCVEQ